MKIVSARARAKQASVQAPKNILCLAVDRLNADFLGAYGNSWIESLAFDSLAAESVLFDSYFTTSFDLETLYRAFWRGEACDAIVDDWKDEPDDVAPKSLFRILKERGYRTYVVSDVEEVALHPCVEGDYCDGRLFLGAPDAAKPVESLEETAFFKNFEQLAKFLAELEDESEFERTPWFVWAHFSGWDKNWDFPLERREKFREDEDDPTPYDGVVPPFFPPEPKVAPKTGVADLESTSQTFDVASDDPLATLRALDPLDRRQSVVEAYSGGVSVFDETLEGFVQLLKETGVLSRALLAVTGVRGYPTGAPGALGSSPAGAAAPFYAEDARLPLAIRLPDGSGATTRLPSICEPRDLFETLRVWSDFANELADAAFWKIEKSDVSPFAGEWNAEKTASSDDVAPSDASDAPDETLDDAPGQNLLALLADESKRARGRVVIVAKDGRSLERALVVDDWFLKETPNASREDEYVSPTRYELFVRPDDRFCVNDVANRRVDDVERLAHALRANR